MNRRFWLKGIVCLLIAGLPAAGQWTNQKKEKAPDPNMRHVHGQVTNEAGEPVAAAVVKLKNMKTMQVKSFLTQTDGKYQFQNLSVNVDYELTCDAPGFESAKRTLTVYDTRRDALVNFKLDPAGKKKDEKSEEK